MPDIKALVINVKPRSQQQGAAGQWQDLTSSIQAFTRDIEEGVSKRCILFFL